MGVTGSSLDEQKRGGTSLIGREHLPSGSCTMENMESLAEKVGTLGLQVTHRNHFSAAKKRTRKVKFGEAPAGDSGSGQPGSAPGGQQHTSQAPSTSGTRQGGPGPAGPKSPKRREHSQGPGKRQLSAGNIPEGGRTKRPRQAGQPGYARAAQGGFWVAVVRSNLQRRLCEHPVGDRPVGG
jgi:hypothetical protein